MCVPTGEYEAQVHSRRYVTVHRTIYIFYAFKPRRKRACCVRYNNIYDPSVLYVHVYRGIILRVVSVHKKDTCYCCHRLLLRFATLDGGFPTGLPVMAFSP